jgi:NAD(P)-dependent dehydrogenase (short-subunit alcohol dehydrogenase family)
MNAFDLSGKMAIVTGGAQGVGKGIALALCQAGCQVLIADIDREALNDCQSIFASEGYTLHTFQADLGKAEGCQALMDFAGEVMQGLDILVNNVGISPVKDFRDLTFTEFDEVLAINLRSVFCCTKFSLPLLEASAQASVVNIGSTRQRMSEPGFEAYAASKGGVVSLTHALAVSLGPAIRVNCISPGWIETGNWQQPARLREVHHSDADKAQHPVGRVGTPMDIGHAVVYLASPAAGFITGQNLFIDGGMTIKMIYV